MPSPFDPLFGFNPYNFGTPGFNPYAEDPREMLKRLAEQTNFGGRPIPQGMSPPNTGTIGGRLSQFGNRLNQGLNSPLGFFGANLLAQSGPSLQPQSFLGNVGQAVGMNDLQRRLIEAKIGKLGRTTPVETMRPLTADEIKARNLDPNRGYQINETTGEVKQVGSGPLVDVNVGGEKGRPTSIFNAAPDVRKRFGDLEASARSAQTTRRAAGNALQLLESDESIFAGAAAPVKELGARVLDVIASEGSDSEKVEAARAQLENSEAFDSQSGIMVGQIIKLFGSGTGLSDADREFARQIAGALRTGSKRGLRRILTNAVDRSTDEITQYNKRLGQSGFEDIGSLYSELELKNFSTPSGPPQGVTREEWNAMTPEEKALFQ